MLFALESNKASVVIDKVLFRFPDGTCLNYHRKIFRKLTFQALALHSDEGLTLETLAF